MSSDIEDERMMDSGSDMESLADEGEEMNEVLGQPLTESQLGIVINFFDTQPFTLSDFLNSLSSSTTFAVRQRIGSWLSSKGPESLMAGWKKADEWSIQRVKALVQEEVRRACSKSTFRARPSMMDDHEELSFDVESIHDDLKTEMPITSSLLERVINKHRPLSKRKRADQQPGRGAVDGDEGRYNLRLKRRRLADDKVGRDNVPDDNGDMSEEEREGELRDEEEAKDQDTHGASSIQPGREHATSNEDIEQVRYHDVQRRRERRRLDRLRRVSTIVSSLSSLLYCRSRGLNRIQLALGLTLFAARVNRRAHMAIHRLGLASSFSTVHRTIRILSNQAHQRLQRIAISSEPKFGLVHDNVNVKLRVKTQSTIAHDQMLNAVAGNVIMLNAQIRLPEEDYPQTSREVFAKLFGPEFKPPTRQIRNCTGKEPLVRRMPASMDYLVSDEMLANLKPSHQTDEHLKAAMSTHLIRCLLDGRDDLAHLKGDIRPPPSILPLVPRASTILPLPFKHLNEGKIDGNIEYLSRILIDYLGMDRNTFQDRVIPVYGDGLTTKNVRSAARQMLFDVEQSSFDNMQFPEAFPGPFHLLMQVVQSFFKLNAGTSFKYDVLSIAHTKFLLEWPRLNLEDPEYHHGDRLIHLYVGALSESFVSKAVVLNEQLTLSELQNAVDNVVNGMLSRNMQGLANQKNQETNKQEDIDTVHCHALSLLRHALIYVELRHAIKNGDPGRMLVLFPYLIAVFKTTGQHNYAAELTEILIRWHTQWDNSMRLTMLCHSLVNSTGNPDGWMGIDQWQEHDVRMYKEDYPFTVQQLQDDGYHERIGSVLHVMRWLKSDLWSHLAVYNSPQGYIRSKKEDMDRLFQHFAASEVTSWIARRRSPVYEVNHGQLRRDYKSGQYDFPAKDPPPRKRISVDPLDRGYQLMLHGKSSLEHYINQRRPSIRAEAFRSAAYWVDRVITGEEVVVPSERHSDDERGTEADEDGTDASSLRLVPESLLRGPRSGLRQNRSRGALPKF